LKGLQNWIW